jgi:hypothetical protein
VYRSRKSKRFAPIQLEFCRRRTGSLLKQEQRKVADLATQVKRQRSHQLCERLNGWLHVVSP